MQLQVSIEQQQTNSYPIEILGMIGYGAAKAATIHIGRSLSADDSGMPKNSSVLTIAPYVRIDFDVKNRLLK